MDSGDRRTQTTGTYADSMARTEQANVDDWQEEVYQKIKAIKEMYLPELNVMYQKIATKLQQQSSLPQQLRSDSEQLDKLKIFKTMLERILMFLQLSKNDILPGYKEKLGSYEEQIIKFIHLNGPIEPAPIMQQGQLPPNLMELKQQQTQPQINQMQSHENQMNPRLQSVNLQGSIPAMQQNIMTNLEHSSMSSPFASMSWPNMMGSLQPGSNLNSAQGNAPQQANMNNMQSQASWLQLQQPSSLQRHTQQKMQASGSSLYPRKRNIIDQQTQLYRSQRNLPEASSNSIAYTGQVNQGDWQEELFEKIKAMKEMYLPELNVMYQTVCAKQQQLDSLPQQPRTSYEQHTCEKFRIVLERIIVYLQVSKSDISPGHKEELVSYEKQIKSFTNLKRLRRE